MAAQQLVEAVNEELCCSICMNRFRVPKMLHCTHSFCEKCLEEYVAKKNGKEMTCPICRQPFTLPAGVKGLQTNIYLLNLCDKIDLYEKLKPSKPATGKCENCKKNTPVTAFCVDCKTAICKNCEEQHSLFAILKSHSIVRSDTLDQQKLQKLKASSAVPMCDLHAPEKLRFYCKSCCKLICRECIVILHPKPDHACVEAASQFEDVKGALSKFLGNCPSELKCVSEYMKNGESGVEQVKIESNTLVKEIQDRYVKVKSVLLGQLDEQLKEAVDKVKDIQTNKESSINESVAMANNWCKRMKSTKEITEKVLRENNMWELLGLSQNLLGSFRALNDDMSHFQWDSSDVALEMVFTPSDIPEIQFGKCFSINDLHMPIVVRSTDGTTYVCSFDRQNSIIEVTGKWLNDVGYANESEQYMEKKLPSINFQQKDHEKLVKISSTTLGSMLILGVHQWLAVAFNRSSSFQSSCKITDTASIVAICGCRNNIYVVYDSDPNTINQLKSFSSYVSQTRRAEAGSINLRSVTQKYKGPVTSYTTTHNITNILSSSNMNTLLLINEAFELIQFNFNSEYVLNVDASGLIGSQVKLLDVLNVYRSRNGTVRQVISRDGHRANLEDVTVFILWTKSKSVTMSQNIRGSNNRMYISQFESSTDSNSSIWEVSVDMGIPRTCHLDHRNRLTVWNASGEFFIFQ